MEENKKKKKKLTPKWFVIKLSGICFAAYAVYYLRMLITYGGEMETKGIVVSSAFFPCLRGRPRRGIVRWPPFAEWC